MRSFQVESAVDALLAVGTELIGSPDFIVSPRGMQTHELRNVTIELTDPQDVTFLKTGRKWSPRIAAAEALQLIGGFSDPEAMVRISPVFEQFLEPSTRKLHGAYGPRTRYAMEVVVQRLQNDPDTRQGVATVWDNLQDAHPYDLMTHPDMPCTTYFNFSIRDNKLLMTTHMRSNDIWRGWCYDAFQFTQLGWTVANYLGIEMGPYTHIVDSMHMYVDDMAAYYEMLEPDQFGERPLLTGIYADAKVDTWIEVQQSAKELFTDPNASMMLNGTETWFVATKVAEYASRED